MWSRLKSCVTSDRTGLVTGERLKDLVNSKAIYIEPRLHDIDACHLDVRLDNQFGVFKSTGEAALDPGVYSRAIEFEETPFFGPPFYIQPGSFVLAQTLEYVALSNSVLAHLDGRSSLGRRGLVVHATAGWIDPGWKGHITLELANLGAMPLALYPTMRIGRLVFETVSPTSGYSGQFQNQYRIREPSVDADCAAIASFSANKTRRLLDDVAKH